MLYLQDEQGGEIGLVVDCEWPEPLSDNLEDKAAATRRLDFQLGWYLLLYLCCGQQVHIIKGSLKWKDPTLQSVIKTVPQ